MGRKAGAMALALLLLTTALAGCVGLGGDDTPIGPTGGNGGNGGGGGGDGPPAPAEPQAGFTFTPAKPRPGETVRFMDTSRPGDAPITEWVWDFGDGTTATCDSSGACTNQSGEAGTIHDLPHAYPRPGLYQVGLRVTDGDGRTSTTRTAIAVVQPPTNGGATLEDDAHVVVAVIDSGVNPYHADFRAAEPRGHPAGWLEGYPASAKALDLTLNTTSYQDARAADKGTWSEVELEALHWVPGTRIVGAMSFAPYATADPLGGGEAPPLILDEDGHGTATASAVARAAPNASIVVVQTDGAELDAAIRWAANQPYIDVISASWGTVANLPTDKAVGAVGVETVRDATLAAAAQGKLVVFAAGNDPTSGATGDGSGPPWVVSVGGADGDARGEVATASEHFDVVGDYYQRLARHDDVAGEREWSGTSFAAPTVAGTLAEAIYQARAGLGHLGVITDGALAVGDAGAGPLEDGRVTAAEVREAMNLTAEYWTATDYDPDGAGRRAAPINPAAPWLQMGWGYVAPGQARTMAAYLWGAGNLAPKPAEAEAYMGAVHALRAAQWS